MPKPNKSAAVIDALRAAGLPDCLGPRDHQAIKGSALSAAAIVAAVGAAFWGDWGDDWLRENLSVRLVIERYAGYLASRRRDASGTSGTAPHKQRGASGPQAVAAVFAREGIYLDGSGRPPDARLGPDEARDGVPGLVRHP